MAQQLAVPAALPEDLGSILAPPPNGLQPRHRGSGALGLSLRALTHRQNTHTHLKKIVKF